MAASQPRRIGRWTIKGRDGGGTLNEIWLGFRSTRFGTMAAWLNRWEAELASTLDADTTAGDDATGTGVGANHKVLTTTFSASAALIERAVLRAYDLDSTNWAQLRGTFDIIARLKVGAGTTCHVRLDCGLMNGSTFTAAQVGDQVVVDSTAWKYYNLGRITWPPAARVTSNLDVMKNAALALYAQRTAGSNSLLTDHFAPIPTDEGYIHVSGLNVAYATNNTNQRAEIYCDALGNIVGVQYGSGAVVGQVTVNATLQTWGMPNLTWPTAEVCNIAAQTASPALSDTLDMTFELVNRYPTMMGAGT